MSEGGPVTRSRSRGGSGSGPSTAAMDKDQLREEEQAMAPAAAGPTAPARIAAEEEAPAAAATNNTSGGSAADDASFPSPAPKPARSSTAELRKARRKLSIISDNALVDGIADIQIDDALTQNAEKGTSVACVVNSYAGTSRKGFAPYNRAKKNQDSLIMAEEPHTASLLFCVLDGHGEFGELVSAFFQRELAKHLFAHDAFLHDPRTAFCEVLQLLEARLLRDPGVDTDFSGTTLTAVLLRGDHMLVFNVGDSRVTAGVVRKPQQPQRQEEEMEGGGGGGGVRRTPPPPLASLSLREGGGAETVVEALPISVDHKPDLPEEKARILAAGGRVFAVEYDDGVDGPPRVWLGHLDIPGLAMSRSLGDAVAHTVGVSSEPEVIERRVDPEEEVFLVIATDGLWEFCSDADVVRIVAGQRDPQRAVDALIKEANHRWLREEQVVDDTTVCVAFLGSWCADALTAAGSPYSPVRR